MTTTPSILVTDASRGSAIAVIRSLGRRGWKVIAADAQPHSAGFASRYATETWVYPDPAEDACGFVAALADFVARRPVDLIIPVTDKAIFPLSESRARFEGQCQLAIPAADALALAANKSQTWQLAQELGVPVPRTHLVRAGACVDAHALDLGWPLVVKPQSSQLRSGDRTLAMHVSYANSANDLATQLSAMEGRCDVLLQEYIRGTGCGVELLLRAGKPLLAFQHERLRELPVQGGASSLRQSVPLDADLFDYAQRLLARLAWNGLAMVEFKVGPDGPRLMEINGRIWGSLPLAVRCGVDFPGALADLYLQPQQADRLTPVSYPHGIRARNLRLDLLWMASVLTQRKLHPFLPKPNRPQAIQALLGLFNPWIRSDCLEWSDPLPGLCEIRGLWQKASSHRPPVREVALHASVR